LRRSRVSFPERKKNQKPKTRPCFGTEKTLTWFFGEEEFVRFVAHLALGRKKSPGKRKEPPPPPHTRLWAEWKEHASTPRKQFGKIVKGGEGLGWKKKGAGEEGTHQQHQWRLSLFRITECKKRGSGW